MVKKIVESERKAFKELMDEVVKINTRNEEIHTEIVRIKKGIDLLEPQRQAKQDIYDALLDDTSKNDLDKAIKQLQDAKEKLDALKVEKAECGKRINEIEKGKKQTQDRIQLGVYLDLRNELLGLQVESYKKRKDLSSEMQELIRSLKDSKMLNAESYLLHPLNRGIL